MTAGVITILVTILTFGIMLAGFALRRHRRVHITLMSIVILYDCSMPVYLFLTRDWYKRLVVNEDILTFGLWMHLGLVMFLYVLYVFQIQAGRQIMMSPPSEEARDNHRKQGIALFITRAFVVLTGAMLYDPQYVL